MTAPLTIGGEDEISFDPDDIIENIEEVSFAACIVYSQQKRTRLI